jgi:hypothetical protein
MFEAILTIQKDQNWGVFSGPMKMQVFSGRKMVNFLDLPIGTLFLSREICHHLKGPAHTSKAPIINDFLK